MAHADLSAAVRCYKRPNRETRRHFIAKICARAHFRYRRSPDQYSVELCRRDQGCLRIEDTCRQRRICLCLFDASDRHRRVDKNCRCWWNDASQEHLVRTEAGGCNVLPEHWGNPSSAYSFGHDVTRQLEEARGKVAALINAEPREIVFTSCGTESNNSAIQSALVGQPEKRHVVTTAVEHSANIKFCEFLKKQGYTVTLLPVDSDGSLDLHLLERAIRPDTAIVTVM